MASQDADARRSDTDLVDAARAGDRAAFGTLWARHAEAGRRVARSITQAFDADDLVSEAYTRIFTAVTAGRGPTGPFRPYLFVTIRNIAISWARSARETTLDEADDVADPRATDATVLAALDSSLTLRAFRTLPERWQEVLWFTEVDALSPARVAERLGMNANGVAALAYRAREGLRQAWIQAHIDTSAVESTHKWTLEHVGKNARGGLSSRNKLRFDAHLEQCPACTVIAAEAVDTSNRFTPALLPLAVGTLGATGLGAFVTSGESAHADTLTAHRSSFEPGSRRRRSGLLLVSGAVVAVILIGAGVGFAVDGHQPNGTPEIASTPTAAHPSPSPSSSGRPTSPPTNKATDSPAPAASPTSEPPVAGKPDRPQGKASSAPTSEPVPTSPLAVSPSISGIDAGGGLLLPIVSGTASSGGSVLVSVGGANTLVQADASGRWSTPPVAVPAGTYQVYATAAGQRTAAQTVTITAPMVFLSSTRDGLTVTVRGAAQTRYAIRVDGQSQGSVLTDRAGKGTVTVAGEGARTVEAAASTGTRVGPATSIRSD